MRGRHTGRFQSTESPSHRLAAATAPFHKGAGRVWCARSLPPSFASQMTPPSSEGGFFPWPPLTRGLSSAARLGERSPRFPCRARQGCCALHITGERSLLWDVFIHLLEILPRHAQFWRPKPPLRGLSCKGFVKIFPTGGVPQVFSREIW